MCATWMCATHVWAICVYIYIHFYMYMYTCVYIIYLQMSYIYVYIYRYAHVPCEACTAAERAPSEIFGQYATLQNTMWYKTVMHSHEKKSASRHIFLHILQKRHIFFMNIDLHTHEKILTEENEIFGQYTTLKNTTCYNKDLNKHDNKTDRQTNEYRPTYTRT